jgi:4-amino-4-deoxy-L-arabinose transferase-like glycosyltransferase
MEKRIHLHLISLILIILIALILRLWRVYDILDTIELHDGIFSTILRTGVMNYIFSTTIFTHYGGPLGYYFLMLFFPLLGVNILALRLSLIIPSVLTVFFLYMFTKEFYGKKEALLASLILSIFPSHITLSRISMPYLYNPFFVILTLYLFYKYYKLGRGVYLYLGAAVAGLAVMIRVTFTFFLLPFIVLIIIFKGKKILKKSFKKLMIASIFFIIGGGYPLIFLYPSENFEIIHSKIKERFPIFSGDMKITIENFIKNFIQLFPASLKGESSLIPYPSHDFFNFFNLFLFAIISVVVLRLASLHPFFKSHLYPITYSFKKDLFILLCLFLTLFSTSMANSLKVDEFAIVFPLVIIIIGKGICGVLEISKINIATFLVAILVISLMIFLPLFYFWNYFSKRSPSICVVHLPDLAKMINEMNYSLVRSDDVVFHDALLWYGVKGGGGSFIFEIRGGKIILDPYLNKILKEPSPDENILYVFQPLECAQQNFREIFKEEVEKNNKEIIEEKNITFGELTYTIYRIGSKK